jgi:hypothetical protein
MVGTDPAARSIDVFQIYPILSRSMSTRRRAEWNESLVTALIRDACIHPSTPKQGYALAKGLLCVCSFRTLHQCFWDLDRLRVVGNSSPIHKCRW